MIMTRILHIDCSPRGDRSHSRTLANGFIGDWKNAYPSDTVIYRDLGHQVIPPVTEAWIAGAFSPPETHTPELKEALTLSEEAIEEFLGVDRYVFSVPMFNFGIPANFKAYIDQICRNKKTFLAKPDGSYEGLVAGKKMLVITARGGSFPKGTPAAQYDFQEPYIRAVFGLMGIIDINFVHAENLAQKGEVREESLGKARNELQGLVAGWS
jgi:FMN-dependent NADH-azoreductase